MNKPADDFVEIPRWVRRLDDGFWFGGLRASRRQIRWIELLLIGGGMLCFAASLVVASDGLEKILRAVAFFELLLGYYVSIASRVIDAYKLWPASEDTSHASQPTRSTWRRIMAQYAFLFGLGAMGAVLIGWLMF